MYQPTTTVTVYNSSSFVESAYLDNGTPSLTAYLTGIPAAIFIRYTNERIQTEQYATEVVFIEAHFLSATYLPKAGQHIYDERNGVWYVIDSVRANYNHVAAAWGSAVRLRGVGG